MAGLNGKTRTVRLWTNYIESNCFSEVYRIPLISIGIRTNIENEV